MKSANTYGKTLRALRAQALPTADTLTESQLARDFFEAQAARRRLLIVRIADAVRLKVIADAGAIDALVFDDPGLLRRWMRRSRRCEALLQRLEARLESEMGVDLPF